MPEGSVQHAAAQDIANYVDSLNPPGRSPFLAGALSIVPGLGHFYVGEWGIGLVALIWNGVFIYATVDSILAERYGQAALIGLLELIWYGGTMFGAVASAHRFNRDAKRIVADGMMKELRELNVDIPWAFSISDRLSFTAQAIGPVLNYVIPDSAKEALASHPHPLIFASLSGAHLYGFPSVDSDVDIRGAHLLPIPRRDRSD